MRLVERSTVAAILIASSFFATEVTANVQLFFFGDSVADSGNNALLVDSGLFPGVAPGSRTATPIPDSTFIPTLPYSSNRYSNGPVWTEQFASALGSSAVPSLAGGNNYAFGGARSGPSGGVPPTVLDQVDMFLNTGSAAASGLYVIEAGANDARDALAVAAGGGDPSSLISGYASSIATAVGDLKTAGARNFLVANVTDIGLLPAVQAQGPVASSFASQIAGAMNQALLAALAGQQTPGTQIHMLDLFGGLRSVYANPSAFGVTNVTSACAVDPACIADDTGVFFWDGIHPTTFGSSIIATAAIQVVPEPSTVWLMLAGIIGWALLRHARSRRGARD